MTPDDGPSTIDVVDHRPVRIRAHPGLCVGWGNCHRFAPSVYPLDEEGHLAVHVLEVDGSLAEDARVGAAACPEHAIRVMAIEPVRAAPS